MDTDLELLLSIWTAMKPLIASKDRLAAADALVRIFDEYGLGDLSDETGLGKELDAAIASYYELNPDEDEDEDEVW